MAIDLGHTQTMGGYSVGYVPPEVCSLAPGLLFVELTPAGGGAPRLWMGTVPGSGFAGNVACILAPGVVPPAPSAITIDPIDNPSQAIAVHITGTVTPGAEVELAAIMGTNMDYLDQVTTWSPWDASSGTFDVTWYLPPGDNYRVRVRMRDDPQVYTDSGLFLVQEPPPT